jgi:hypothetical protein
MTSKTGRIRLPDREGSSATGSRVITPTFVREGIDGSDLSPIYQARWNNTVRSIRAAGVSVDAEVAWAFVDTDGNQYADGSVSEGSIVFEVIRSVSGWWRVLVTEFESTQVRLGSLLGTSTAGDVDGISHFEPPELCWWVWILCRHFQC